MARQILVVGRQVEQAVAAQVKEDRFALARFFGLQRFVNRGAYGVSRFGRGHYPLATGELHSRLEYRVLRVGYRFDEAALHKVAHERGRAVIPQPARVDGLRHERMPKSVHLDYWGHTHTIPEVV